MTMQTFVDGLRIGIVGGFKWYGRRIQESKWYIIPFVIDMLMIPLKIIIIPLACLTKLGRVLILTAYEEVSEG